MGANDMAAIVYTSGRTDGSQEFTSNKQLLYAGIDRFVGRRLRSLTLERLDTYYSAVVDVGTTGPAESGGHTHRPRCSQQDGPGDISGDSGPSVCWTR